jgi:capsular polysaccharide biosynthesis protein
MSQQPFSLRTILHAWPLILVIAATGLFLGVVLSFLRPLEYSSTTRLIIRQNLGAVDVYTAARSAERVADDLSIGIYTDEVYDAVLEHSAAIDESYFGEERRKIRDNWEDAISTAVSRGTGYLTIKVYHTDVAQAELVASTIATVLTEQGTDFTSGTNIEIRVVDQPLNSKWPVRPNILVNAFSGLVLGLLAGVGYVLIESERMRRRHTFINE